MNPIEVTCMLIGTVATILAGVWFIIKYAIKSGVKEHRLNEIEKAKKKE